MNRLLDSTPLRSPRPMLGGLESHCNPKEQPRVYGATVEIHVLFPKASLSKFGECRLIVARSWVERA
jgi:hypothetical protein